LGGLTSRLAGLGDLPALEAVMAASIAELQKGFLTPQQIEASRTIMGLDRQLVADGTYFVVEAEGEIAGCGGWSRRATLYGGDHTPGRDPEPLDPATDAARVRAMYTHPAFARRGAGRLILQLCEDAARAAGFSRLELMATLAGRPLYESYGFVAIEDILDARGGAPVPLTRMGKSIAP
jgi:GNAT superfamily N-acetyltransferase